MARFVFGNLPKPNLVSVSLLRELKYRAYCGHFGFFEWAGRAIPEDLGKNFQIVALFPTKAMNLPQTNLGASKSKAEIYQSLYAINQSLQEVIGHLDKLKAADVLTASFAEVRCLVAEQMRSEINLTATIRLHASEFGDAHAFEQQRLTLEQKLRESQENLPQPEPPAAPQKPKV